VFVCIDFKDLKEVLKRFYFSEEQQSSISSSPASRSNIICGSGNVENI